MPPSSSESDLKRLARRRLIGAVALTLLAVIVLPLLLEDEPPPASSLAVHMVAAPQPVLDPVVQPDPADEPEVAAAPPSPPAPQPAPQIEPAKPLPQAEPAPKPEPVKAASVKPVTAPPLPKPVAAPAPPAASEAFVVQLAALSDSAKAQALKTRAAEAGLPAYTDKVGALTRVRVGPYPSREAAVAAAVKLAENGMTGQILTK